MKEEVKEERREERHEHQERRGRGGFEHRPRRDEPPKEQKREPKKEQQVPTLTAEEKEEGWETNPIKQKPKTDNKKKGSFGNDRKPRGRGGYNGRSYK